MLSVSMMTACGSKESDNDKKDVGSETKQDVFTYDLKGVTVAMNENMEPLVKKLGDADNYFESDSCAFQGKDKVYTYGSVKITTYPKDNKDYVYTIELLDDKYTTINEQITKIAQNHPAIVKTSSSEAPCWISR